MPVCFDSECLFIIEAADQGARDCGRPEITINDILSAIIDAIDGLNLLEKFIEDNTTWDIHRH